MDGKVKRTPLDDLLTVVQKNYFLQYASIVPMVVIMIWLFGFYSVWTGFTVVAIGYSIRAVAFVKADTYTKFSERIPITRNKREIQQCAWLNLLVRKYWISCVPKFVEPQMEKVNTILSEKKPGFMVS